MNTRTPTTKSVTPAPARTVASTPTVSYFDGNTLGLIGWSTLAYLIIIITLGLGSPWAICLILKWQIGHTVVNGQRLKFTGSGGSLFLRWILWTLLTILTLGIYIIFATVDFEKWKAEHTVSSADRKSKPPIKSKKFLLILIPIILIAEIVGFIFLYNKVLTNMDWFPTVPYIDIDELKGESSTTTKSISTAKNNSSKEDMVSVTIPNTIFQLYDDSLSEEDLIIAAEDNDVKMVKNDDHSYTYTMSKKKHNELMDNAKQSALNYVDDFLHENPYTSITDVRYNDDFTEIYIYTNSENENVISGIADGTFKLGLVAIISYYHAFNGISADEIQFAYIYIDSDTNTEYDRFIFPDNFDFDALNELDNFE